MAIITVGIDLAKSVVAVHGVDASGKAVPIKPKLTDIKNGFQLLSADACR